MVVGIDTPSCRMGRRAGWASYEWTDLSTPDHRTDTAQGTLEQSGEDGLGAR